MGDQDELETEVPRRTFAEVVDKNFRYLQVAAYGMGCVGLVMIVRAVRLTKKFELINDIPADFFRKRVKLYGTMEAIKVDDKNSLIIGLNHTPIISLKRHSIRHKEIKPSINSSKIGYAHNDRMLVFAVPGVSVSAPFLPHIHEKASSQEIKVTLLGKCDTPNRAYAYVGFRSSGMLPFYTDLGKWCMQNGIAKVRPREVFRQQLTGPPFYIKAKDADYYEQLLEEGIKAKRKRLGVWKEDQKPTVRSRWNFNSWFNPLSKFRKK